MNYNNAVFEKAFATAEQLEESDLPEICFCGRSNVGKSSLINAVLGRKSIARVSSKPGKTVTVNFYRVDGMRLVDLPGYGYAKVPFSERDRWSQLMEGYFNSGRDIKTAFQLIDMRHPASQDDMNMISFLCDYGFPFVLVLTKSDKLNKTETAARLADFEKQFSEYENLTMIPFSSKNGQGADEIKRVISECVADCGADA